MTDQKRLAEEYARDYMGKIFYYCLRKTGDSHEAEDLASDITFQILTALHEGVEILNFPAWVWQIARNRYALWAKTRHRRGETESFIDPDDPETENVLTAGGYNTTPSVAEAYAHDEEMAILRRELAFLGRDYREIVVAYYIEDRSVGDIAKALGQPEGTVKSRLFRSRNLLKEGMKMAREFGPKSYRPEEVRFVSSGGQASGLPFSAVQRTLPKNILLEASNNPSTIEELAVAVGVAMPYMEEEVAELEHDQLLKKVGNRYITNFFIESHSLQTEIRNELLRMTHNWVARYDHILSDAVRLFREGCFVPADMTDSDIKWQIALSLVDFYATHCDGYTMEFPVKHTHPGDNWGFIGFEGNGVEGDWFVGHNGYGIDEHTSFWTYDIQKWNMRRRAAIPEGAAIALVGDLIRKGRSIETLTDTEKRLWDTVNGRIVHADENGRVIPDVITFHRGEQTAIFEKLMAHPEHDALQADMQMVFNRIQALLRREGHAILEDQLPFCTSAHLWQPRAMLLDTLVDNGILTVPSDPDRSTVAMALYLK